MRSLNPELSSVLYALSISMDLLVGLRSVGFVTGADILALCIAGGLVIGGDVAVGGRGTVGADVAGVGCC